MEFSLTEEQQAVRDLARRILDDQATPERLAEVEAGRDWFDDKLWSDLAASNLLGIALPTDVGGSGYGFLEACLVLEQVGRTVAPVPVFATVVLGALPLARFGSPEQQNRLLPGAVEGSTILTAALVEPGSVDPSVPVTRAVPRAGDWRVDGIKTCVPAVHLARRVLVPAQMPDGEPAVILVDPAADGITLERQTTISGEPQFRMELTGVAVTEADIVRGHGILPWMVERATAALSVVELGLADQALQMTARYTSERKQFDRPLATFQAVAQRAADCYIDVLAMRWTAWNAVWRLDRELPATDEVAIAKFWASDAGHRVVSAAQHLHGGVGVDLSYPLHRYFRWSKQIELLLGGAPRQLLALGRRLAAR